jgi:hypothetical protein
MLQFFRRASQVVPNGTRPPQLSCLSGQWFLTDVYKIVLKVLNIAKNGGKRAPAAPFLSLEGMEFLSQSQKHAVDFIYLLAS